MNTVHINLRGSYEAECDGYHLKARNYVSPIPPMARKLLQNGYNGSDEVMVTRGSTVCFAGDTLQWWAEKQISEPEWGKLAVRKYNFGVGTDD